MITGRESDAFEALVVPHWNAMAYLAARYCGPADFEDVLQESLALAWRHRAKYDASRGSARSWLLAITRNQCLKHGRRQRFNTVPEEPTAAPELDMDRSIDLNRALRSLTDRQRMAVELRYFVGLPVIEVGEVMGCSEGTVKSTLSDARSKLRDLVQEI